MKVEHNQQLHNYLHVGDPAINIHKRKGTAGIVSSFKLGNEMPVFKINFVSLLHFYSIIQEYPLVEEEDEPPSIFQEPSDDR